MRLGGSVTVLRVGEFVPEGQICLDPCLISACVRPRRRFNPLASSGELHDLTVSHSICVVLGEVCRGRSQENTLQTAGLGLATSRHEATDLHNGLSEAILDSICCVVHLELALSARSVVRPLSLIHI